MKKVARPSRTIPTCSCGWACSSTTTCGAMSTTDSIIRSAAQVRIWTPGKIVCRAHSSGEGKYRLTGEGRWEKPAGGGVAREAAPAAHGGGLGALGGDPGPGRGGGKDGARNPGGLP